MSEQMVKFLTVFSLFLTFTFLSATSVEAQSQRTEHIVEAGETLFSISREYNISVSDLRAWNELESDNLQPGQVLSLLPADSDNRITHVVKAGESLFAISRRYGVTIAEIQQWNQLAGTALDVGRELVLYSSIDHGETTPPPSITEMEQMDEAQRTSIVRDMDSATGSENYVVRSGDTLYQIARDHNMSVNELRSLNNLDNDMLRVGQRIMVRRVRTAPSIAEGAADSTPQGKFTTYRVRSGENMQSLLTRFKMSRNELMALNPGLEGSSVTGGQQLTVLLPPSRNFRNPYQRDANLEDLGTVPVTRYQMSDRASPTTGGELYNPSQLTAAHSNMALGNVIYVENPNNGHGVFVRVNDRQSGDGLKLSNKAYEMLRFSNVEQPMVTIYLDN
jgi:LysM repeat protein